MLAITIALSWWMLPLSLTIIMLIIMNRPLSKTSGSDMFGIGQALEGFSRLFWILPILLSWLIYFIVF